MRQAGSFGAVLCCASAPLLTATPISRAARRTLIMPSFQVSFDGGVVVEARAGGPSTRGPRGTAVARSGDADVHRDDGQAEYAGRGAGGRGRLRNTTLL